MSGGGWHWRAVWRASTRAPHDAQTPRNLSGGRGDSSRESESEDSEDSDAVGVLPLRAASQQGQAAADGCYGRWRGQMGGACQVRASRPASSPSRAWRAARGQVPAPTNRNVRLAPSFDNHTSRDLRHGSCTGAPR